MVEKEYQKQLKEREDGLITGSDDQLFNKATDLVLTELRRQVEINEGLAKQRLLRQINTLEGIDNLGIFNEKGEIIPTTALIGRQLTTSNLFENSPANYAQKSNNEKLSLIRKEIADNNNNLVSVRSKMSDLFDKGKPNADEKAFAIDLLTYIDALRSEDKELIEGFTPPSSNISNITDLNKTVEQFQGSKLLQGEGAAPLFDAKTLQTDQELPKKKSVEEINKNSPFNEDNTASNINKNGNLIGSNTPSGNGSGLFAFIPTKPLDGYNFSNITYGIVGA